MEEWRAVPGFEGLYEVSSLGRVRSLDRVVVQKNGKGLHETCYRGRVLRPGMSHEYPRYRLSKQNIPADYNVHTLVAAAFIGSCPPGMEVCHNDGNGLNNVPENLRYDTCAANQADKRLHGTMPIGEQHHAAKVTADQVREIRSLKGKVSERALAARYGVDRGCISGILRGKTWTHIEQEVGQCAS